MNQSKTAFIGFVTVCILAAAGSQLALHSTSGQDAMYEPRPRYIVPHHADWDAHQNALQFDLLGVLEDLRLGETIHLDALGMDGQQGFLWACETMSVPSTHIVTRRCAFEMVAELMMTGALTDAQRSSARDMLLENMATRDLVDDSVRARIAAAGCVRVFELGLDDPELAAAAQAVQDDPATTLWRTALRDAPG